MKSILIIIILLLVFSQCKKNEKSESISDLEICVLQYNNYFNFLEYRINSLQHNINEELTNKTKKSNNIDSLEIVFNRVFVSLNEFEYNLENNIAYSGSYMTDLYNINDFYFDTLSHRVKDRKYGLPNLKNEIRKFKKDLRGMLIGEEAKMVDVVNINKIPGNQNVLIQWEQIQFYGSSKYLYKLIILEYKYTIMKLYYILVLLR